MLETCGSGELVQFNIVVQQALWCSRHYGAAGITVQQVTVQQPQADLSAQFEAV